MYIVYRLVLYLLVLGSPAQGITAQGEVKHNAFGSGTLQQSEDSVFLEKEEEEEYHTYNHARQMKQFVQGPSTEVLCDTYQLDCEFVTPAGASQSLQNLMQTFMSAPSSEIFQALQFDDYEQVADAILSSSFADDILSPKQEALFDGLDFENQNFFLQGDDDVDCVDVPFPGTTCDVILQSGMCTNDIIVPEGYCLATCNACDSSPDVDTFPPPSVELQCDDIPIPGTADCSKVIENDLCTNAQVIANQNCRRTCGLCGSNQAEGDPIIFNTSPPSTIGTILEQPPPQSNFLFPPPPQGLGTLQISEPPPPSSAMLQDPPPSPLTPPPPFPSSPPPTFFPPPPLLLGFLPSPLFSLQPPPPTPTSSEGCVDVIFPGMSNCISILDAGLCDADYIVDGRYCSKTCNLCAAPPPPIAAAIPNTFEPLAPPPPTGEICVDELLPGVASCDLVRDSGLCSAEVTDQGFCLVTCDACPPSIDLDCTGEDAVECDVQGLQALIPTFSGNDPCNEISGVSCGTSGRVTAISLGLLFHSEDDSEVSWKVEENPNFLDLSGQIFPAELSKLVFLNTFEVEATGLEGSIPPELSTLTDLRIFDVDGDTLTGTLPVQLSTWINMRWFDISNSQITGSLPSSYSEWSAVELMDASESGLSGALPQEWSEMERLKFFYLYNAGPFTGSIPSEWTTFIDSMVELQVGIQPELCIGAVQQLQLSSFSQDIANLNVC